MELVPGDIVFSFFNTFIQAVGIVQARAVTAPKPEFGAAGDPWDSVGWLVEVDYSHLPSPFRPREHMQSLATLLPSKYSPLQENGDGLQGVYLTEVSPEFAHALTVAGQVELDLIRRALAPTPRIDDGGGSDQALTEVELDPKSTSGDVERLQLGLARRGQGVFKYNVRLIESECRLTGVSDQRHLRASHIKPWRTSTSAEKIDGSNGLLMSPHVDHLFDRGLISFRSTGEIIRSPLLTGDVMKRWHLESIETVGRFSSEQDSYLEYHRDAVLRTS